MSRPTSTTTNTLTSLSRQLLQPCSATRSVRRPGWRRSGLFFCADDPARHSSSLLAARSRGDGGGGGGGGGARGWQELCVRTYSSGSRYKTIQQQEGRYRSGPFSWKAGLLFLASGVGLTLYFQYEKARLERKRIAEHTKGIGKPKVGGAFTLTDHEGRPFTHEDLRGRYALVYFGFTHCPDICPDELDKMSRMIDIVAAKLGPDVLRPVVISCDPARDTPAVLKAYLREFHPAMIGLTGSWDQIKAICKAYRVYFSTPENVKPGQDYLVDHSIYFYLMDPEGDFVECIGRQHSAEQGAKLITDHIGDWTGKLS